MNRNRSGSAHQQRLSGRSLRTSRRWLLSLLLLLPGLFPVGAAELLAAPSILTTFLYDADGQRVGKRVVEWDEVEQRWRTNFTRFLIDPQHPSGYAQRVAERGEDGEGDRSYLHGLHPIAEAAMDRVSYALVDGHHSVRGHVKDGGTLADLRGYDAFGSPLVALMEPTRTVAEEDREAAGYAGEFYDPASGLQDLRARQYEPDVGRFRTMDSYEGQRELPAGLHKYSYALADPVNNTDPSGYDPSLTISGQVSIQTIYQNSQALGGGTLATFAHSVRGSLLYRIGTYAVLGTTIGGNIALVTDAVLETQPRFLNFKRAPSLEEDGEPPGDLTVHRMGGKSNMGLTSAEDALNPPGFSVLIGGSPQEAAFQFRTAFPFPRTIALSKTVGSAKISSVRAAGFDVVAKPGTLANHGRLYHQSRMATPFQNSAWQRVLSDVFTDHAVP
ncbi:MAG: RHS repeat-associated core domain-containing protein [Verrucomicrobiales bacterium]|nr:RHS repeat-associated core domain-containing protein [Verrucomicrobiales bacterium]